MRHEIRIVREVLEEMTFLVMTNPLMMFLKDRKVSVNGKDLTFILPFFLYGFPFIPFIIQLLR